MAQPQTVHGDIIFPDSDRRDFLYRVSLKAVVLNAEGEVLVVKETGRNWWDIPGGGIDHGESVKDALARELNEEVGYTGGFEYEAILAEDPRFLEAHNLYQMRITFLVTPDNFAFTAGEHGDEIMFVNPDAFKDSTLFSEQKIYEYSQLALKRLANH